MTTLTKPSLGDIVGPRVSNTMIRISGSKRFFHIVKSCMVDKALYTCGVLYIRRYSSVSLVYKIDTIAKQV